jgi:hypothetical protein
MWGLAYLLPGMGTVFYGLDEVYLCDEGHALRPESLFGFCGLPWLSLVGPVELTHDLERQGVGELLLAITHLWFSAMITRQLIKTHKAIAIAIKLRAINVKNLALLTFYLLEVTDSREWRFQ